MELRQYYDILGVKPGASLAEIRQTFRDSVKVWHPDRFTNDPCLQLKAQEKLKKIIEAYRKITTAVFSNASSFSEPEFSCGEEGENESETRAPDDAPGPVGREGQGKEQTSSGEPQMYAATHTDDADDLKVSPKPIACTFGVITIAFIVNITKKFHGLGALETGLVCLGALLFGNCLGGYLSTVINESRICKYGAKMVASGFCLAYFVAMTLLTFCILRTTALTP